LSLDAQQLKASSGRCTQHSLTLSAAELRSRKKLCATYRACERTWFSHVQAIRARSRPVPVNGESNSLEDSKMAVDSAVLPSSSLNRHARAYHSFREGSVDLESVTSSTLNTLDLTNQRASSLRRHCSARSATLPSPSSTQLSSDSSGVLSNKISPAVNKTKEACHATLRDYYRAAMSAEEARVEWHTVLLKCLDKQRSLERQRLFAMVNGLTVYQRVVNEAIPELKAMATELTDALRLADPSADLDLFRKRSHAESALNETNNADTQSPPTLSLNFKNGCKLTGGVVGRSQQRLLELPGERSMIQHLFYRRGGFVYTDSEQSPNDRTTLDRSSIKPKWSSGTPSRDSSLREHLRECLTRECLFEHLDLLAKDVQKERRTKQGLSNLVQVYSREPAYADAQTLVEVRRRLFVSRVRLTHLTNCRQKFIYSLICALSGGQNTTTNGELPKHIYADALVRAGFTDLPWFTVPSLSDAQSTSVKSPAVRWIPIPDLDDEPSVNSLTKPPEWPPFPSTELGYEDLNEDLFEWEVERLRLLDADQRDNGPWNPIPLAVSNITETIASNWKISSVRTGITNVVPNTPVTTATTTTLALNNTNSNRTVNNSITANMVIPNPKIINDVNVHIFSPSKRWSGEYPLSSSRSSVRPSQLKIGCTTTNGLNELPSSRFLERSSDEKLNSPVDLNKRSSAVVTQTEIGILPKSPTLASQEISDIDLGEPFSASSAHVRSPASSGRSRLPVFSFARFRRPSSSVSVKRAQSFDHSTTSPDPQLNIESVAAIHPNEFSGEHPMGQDKNTEAAVEKQNDAHSFSSKFWSKLRSSGRYQSNHTKSATKIIGTSPQPADSVMSDQLVKELTQVQRFRQTSTDRSFPSANLTANGYSHRTVHFGPVESHAITPDIDYPSSGSQWPSNLSLHCVGWAKVERSYIAKNPDELTLLEGEIVSIYRKENNDWWYGEVNGSKGRFPVSHVDEF
ncbi:hypothetical protein FGIG_00065, partial [Fasciola gigantica]